MKYICLNPIAEAGLQKLPPFFEKTENLGDADAVLVRSAKMHEMDFPPCLKAVGRAGAGVNNIPVDRLSEAGVVVFNTPGANANGVKELVILGLILAARDAKGGMKWIEENREDPELSKSMEKAKAKYAGTEIRGKTLGVIGLGAIGVLVANNAVDLGMKVIGYDPFLSVSHALHLNPAVSVENSLDTLYTACDYLTIHVPENPSTRGMLNSDAFSKMKDGAALLNFARDGLVNEDALSEALSSGKLRIYVTDVPNHRVANLPNVIAFPHLGASTEESETNCAVMAAEEITDFLLNGNITNSVNFPNCTLGHAEKPVRIAVAHRNVANVISSITSVFGAVHANISDMVSKSRGDYAYALFDLDSEIDDDAAGKIREIPNVLRVELIRR